ncbi:endonuclease/exonuclease/phosphatase family protein, partial [uncultured Eudoraea sp.]|uniref:endonuclease/exonuclease/phosphatase family protein n=1 Tax=uncultured Eudoraea sp. TaxID=1035614 RepID=UPI00262028A6
MLSLAAVLSSYIVLGSFYKFGSTNGTSEDNDLSIMTFNTREFNFSGRAKGESTGNEIKNFVLDQDPDIVCFQEFGRMVQLEQYPYKYKTDFPSNKSSQAIFSKYPIVGTGSLEFPNTANNALFADILYKADTIRVYNIHFQSYKVIPSRLKRIRPAFKIYGKMRMAFMKQEEQVQIFVNHRKNSPYRTIVCGDFNNTSFSNMYRIAIAEMKDTFDERGTGIGKTFDLKFIPFRIDFILV